MKGATCMKEGSFAVLLLGMLCLSSTLSYAEWTKDINCPSGTEYRDLRPYAGREEFCERLLPGSLRVKHGPYRFWYNEQFPEVRGQYTNGRRSGLWRDCDKNGHCNRVKYSLLYPEEKSRAGVRQEVPITFRNGKYRFDFGSCWSTWVTQTGTEDIDLNVGGDKYRCFVAYLPKHVTEHGGEGSYLCWVPYSVGAREMRSLELWREFPKLGLPQFCRPERTTTEPLMITDRSFRDIAYSMDVQCASMEGPSQSEDWFVFRFNPFITNLLVEAASNEGPLTTRLCFGPAGSNVDQPTEILHEPNGMTLFRYRFSQEPGIARQQKKCVAKTFKLQESCR